MALPVLTIAPHIASKLTAIFASPWRQLVYIFDGETFQRVDGQPGSMTPDGAYETNGRPSRLPSFWQRLFSDIAIRLSDEDVLQVRKFIPVPKRALVGSFIANNIATIVPLTSDVLSTQYVILGKTENGFDVRIAVVKRDIIERLWKLDRSLGLCADRIMLGDSTLFLLRSANERSRLSVLLGCTTMLLLALPALYAAQLYNRVAQNKLTIESLDQSIINAQAAAKNLRERRSMLEKQDAAVATLNDEKSKTPHLVLLLDELSKSVPDNAWLNQIQFQGGKVTISGFGASASTVIDALNNSNWLGDAATAGPIVMDPVHKAERFVINASAKRD